MQNPTLKRGSVLYDDIERLQLALDELGYSVDIDARFGPGLEREVRAFQAHEGLLESGVVNDETWTSLAAQSVYAKPLVIDMDQLPGFRGDIAWIHRWEGHAGRPYWPGGASGVTIDPGLDLGHAEPALIERALGNRLTKVQLDVVRRVRGLRGDEAKNALDLESTLHGIRVLRTTATEIFPLVAKPYWATLCRRFATLVEASTPGEIHTAMLSLAYNRGAGNRAIAALGESITATDWLGLADAVGAMQQDHGLEGIRRRRRAEGELIRSAVS